MEMSVENVNEQLQELHNGGISLSKKKIKKTHPELVKGALYYYPSWEHALQENNLN